MFHEPVLLLCGGEFYDTARENSCEIAFVLYTEENVTSKIIMYLLMSVSELVLFHRLCRKHLYI